MFSISSIFKLANDFCENPFFLAISKCLKHASTTVFPVIIRFLREKPSAKRLIADSSVGIKYIEEQQERKLSTFEKVSIPLDIIIVLTGIIGSILIIIGGIFHVKKMFSFENENPEELRTYFTVDNNDIIDPTDLDF